ncbi:hypothetical protein CBQ26_19420 [Deinococcus indicus]|uniref:Uncharacterized protein n=1 Tax=Deinococcus indicus TaxID=223556 RepID=A0A246BF70_9DEIO|nr:hypothetical protein [Deinococcus indicus]OWL93535.1 hypothetical protein CBQ26_19420 [Deinococcus indicus]
MSLTFTFPDTPAVDTLRLSGVAFGANGQYLQTIGYGGYLGSPPGNVANRANVYLDGYSLQNLQKTACLSPFKGGETDGMRDVVVSPENVQTCNVYFVIYNDLNRNGRPESTEELYQTHSIYSYASEAFTYSFTSADGRTTESGARRKGWSLVAHEVRHPSATPGRYVVTMNSVPEADEGLAVRLHEPTNRLISQRAPLGGTPGGAK